MGAVAALAGAAPVFAEPPPPEPLVVTRLHDPDLDYSSMLQGQSGALRETGVDRDRAGLDESIEDFGRLLAEATKAQEETIRRRCRSSKAKLTSAADRMAWQAACTYTRR